MYNEKYKICEGKSKIIWQDPNDSSQVLIQNKSVITAGDGKKRDFLPNKDEMATETTCNVFHFLHTHGVATHYLKRANSITFLAKKVSMIPIEVVIRKIAFGSYLKRHPEVPEGALFSPLVTEFFLKDDENHDPLMIWEENENKFILCNSQEPLGDGWIRLFDPSLLVNGSLIPKNTLEIQNIRKLAVEVFWLLEKVWADLQVQLVDLKIEMGFDSETGNLLVADVIDNDSWRIWPQSDKFQMKDKQVYRDFKEITPEAIKAIQENYKWVSEITFRFKY
ncbi:MAG: phosphoribosylaminoimidazolesuccinocarboxamide synthase [Candidatus Brennerbacteria bacterium]|nr:phosphoribosylaminoimidazolesuccinocarboxamide synthase [Candidatus Brennerbacteria bacterium]